MSDPVIHPAPESGGGLKIPILFGVVIALLAANVYLFLQLDQVRTDVTKLRESILSEVSNLRETSSATVQTNRRHLDSLRTELDSARRAAASAVGQAKEDAVKHADEVQKRLEDAQRRQAERVQSELSRVEQTAATKIGEVSTEVGTVKQEVATTKGELEKTISDLKRVTGDLGETSGLVATNIKQLAALKELGERNYFEFNLVKAKQPQRIADVLVLLKNADLKKNKYTVELIADDKRFEKKDKNLNEPVQFYVAKYPRQPYELVVNEIKKDRIVGYLSQPKVVATRVN